MPHFFVQTKDILDNKIRITEKDTLHHLVRVLRVKTGETLLLTDENQTQYRTEIVCIASDYVESEIKETLKANHSLCIKLYLAQSVLKNDAQNLVIQKATELGVKGIIPVLGDNTVLKDSVIDSKTEKWQKIALEAVKQCERTDIPRVFTRDNLESLLKSNEYKIKIACVERSDKGTLKEVLRNLHFCNEDKILVIIGPEGGFSQRELELLETSDVYRVSLGKLILRAETAAVTALSNIIYELEDD